MDKDKKCTKIHIVGYRNEFNECQIDSDISYCLSASKKFMFQTKNRWKAESKCFTAVYIDFVERLSENCGLAGKCPGTTRVQIELPVEQDVFDTELDQATENCKYERGNFDD